MSVRFRADVGNLETAIVFAFEHVTCEEALPEIRKLTKAGVAELVEELFKAKGYGFEFVGESTEPEIVKAAEDKVRELWPKLVAETE